jgi:glycosyltransferase 2 family protein
VLTFFKTLKDKINYRYVSIIISLSLVGFAGYVLYKKLKNISWTRVFEYMAATPTTAFIYAGLFTIAAYLTLTFYDYFAVRTIERNDVKYRETALASFSSYSIAHNLGATMFTATLVRFLIYSRYGLSAGDVIKVSFIAGLTFWLGNATVLGLGFALEPWAIAPIVANLGLTAVSVRVAGVLILTALVAYITWMHFGNRKFGKGDWSLTLPDSKLTALQVVIGIIDLTFCALIMYVLLPKGIGHVPFRELMVIFVASMLLGFASHAPGGVGAFEAAMILALPKIDKEQLVAAIILFRIYYFLIPFALALITIFVREFVFGGGNLSSLKEQMQAVRQAEAKTHVKK